MRKFKKISAAVIAAAMLIQLSGTNVIAEEVTVENEGNHEGDMTLEEVEQFFDAIDAEGVEIKNDLELSEFLLQDKKNMIEAYEYREKEEKNKIVLNDIRNKLSVLRTELSKYSLNNNVVTLSSDSLPSSVDITTDSATSKYFPNIMNQGTKGSCQFCSMYYYMFSYEANRLNNISSKSLGNCYSPEWGYVQYENIRDGILDALKYFGAVKWFDFEYIPEEGKNRNISEVSQDALFEALKTRLDSYRKIKNPFENSPIINGNHATLTEIKNTLNAKKPIYCVCCMEQGWVKMKTSTGEEIITRFGITEKTHALTIVGYNDNIWCDVNGNNRKDAGETGALKVANSWGTYTGNNGYHWVLYDALNGTSQIKDFDESKHTSTVRIPAFLGEFMVFNVKAYRPMIIAKLNFNGWNPDKTIVSWGSNKIDDKVDLENDETIPINTVRFYDYADDADTVGELLGEKTFYVNIKNRVNGDKSNYFSRVNYSLIDSNKTRIQDNIGTCFNNTTIDFNTFLKLGDIDYDKKITDTDANTVLSIALGSKDDASNLQMLLADYNKDGKVNLNDAKAVLKIKQ